MRKQNRRHSPGDGALGFQAQRTIATSYEGKYIMSDIPATSGIYKITCTVTKKTYIGSAVDLCKRKREHFNALRQNRHSNPYLQRAWNKYGEESFTFEVLELVLLMSLTAREQYWFNRLKPFGKRGFNIAREAGSNLGVKMPPESVEKMRQSHLDLGRKNSPEARKTMGQANLGRKNSPSHVEKVRQANLGRKKSPSHVEKMRQSHLGIRQSPAAIEKMLQTKRSKKQTLLND